MKLLPILVLNLVTVAGALVVYDQLRGEPEQAAPDLELAAPDITEIEGRLAALEAARRPQLQAAGADPRLLERLSVLESAARLSTATAGPSREEPTPTANAPSTAAGDAPAAAEDEPSAEEIRRFRRLRKAVQFEEAMEKTRARVHTALGRLSLNLSKRQRGKIHAAFTRFQPEIDRIWIDVKAQARATQKAGGTPNRGEIVASTTALIQQEFVKTINGVVASADAEAIAEGLLGGRK